MIVNIDFWRFSVDSLSMTIIIGIIAMLIIFILFVFTVKSGQYDDLEGPAHRILMDDDDPKIPGNQSVMESSESESKLREK